MAANRPAGPRPVLVVVFLAGCGLLIWTCLAPSVHIVWQAPLGALLAVSSLGKMASR